jgi:hypothetical protein
VAAAVAVADSTSTEESFGRLGWRARLPAVLLAALAIVHLALVFGVGVSRWRVGGMGMYSEPHPNSREVVFVRDHREIYGRTLTDACTDGEDLRRAAATHPLELNLRTFATACLVENLRGWTVRVIEPAVDVDSLELRRNVVREVRW